MSTVENFEAKHDTIILPSPESFGNMGYIVLDTRALDEAIARKDGLISAYNALNEEYDRIVKNLLANWEGRGATAFKKDATTVKTNIVGIYDNLTHLCDILIDCKDVFSECDTGLGDYNRNPNSSSGTGGSSGSSSSGSSSSGSSSSGGSSSGSSSSGSGS